MTNTAWAEERRGRKKESQRWCWGRRRTRRPYKLRPAIPPLLLVAADTRAQAILQKGLTAGLLANAVRNLTAGGVPPGGPRSPVLANLPLDGLEHKRRETYPQATVQSRRATVHRMRWADDCISPGSS